jgi:hypothetical protein
MSMEARMHNYIMYCIRCWLYLESITSFQSSTYTRNFKKTFVPKFTDKTKFVKFKFCPYIILGKSYFCVENYSNFEVEHLSENVLAEIEFCKIDP